MKLYGVASSRSRRCLWTLEEAGAAYEFHKIEFSKGEHRSPEYLKLNPNGRVPTLVDGDLVLFESAAISHYIAYKNPQANLLPAEGTRDRALHDQWMFWIVSELEQGLWSMGKHRFALPEEHRIDAMLSTAKFEFDRAAPVLAKAIEGREFLVGDGLTLSDIFAGHTLLWARGFKVDLGSDVLEAYLDRLIARPAFTRTRAHE